MTVEKCLPRNFQFRKRRLRTGKERKKEVEDTACLPASTDYFIHKIDLLNNVVYLHVKSLLPEDEATLCGKLLFKSVVIRF